jgi:hypothetical protein
MSDTKQAGKGDRNRSTSTKFRDSRYWRKDVYKDKQTEKEDEARNELKEHNQPKP